MANPNFDTDISNLEQTPTDESMEVLTPLMADPKGVQDNTTDLTQATPKAEASNHQKYNDQWSTCEELHTIKETLHKMNEKLHHIHTALGKVSKHIHLRNQLQPSIHDFVTKRTCYNCGKVGHLARNCRTTKVSFDPTPRNAHKPRSKNRQFLDITNRMMAQSINSPQQSDFRPQELRTNGSNSSQDTFQNKSPNKVQRDRRCHIPISSKNTVVSSAPTIKFV